MKKYKKKKEVNIELIVSIISIAITLVIVLWRPINKVSDFREVTTTVTDKTVKNVHGKEDKYLIFTKDEAGNVETYEITDSLFMRRFDSSDLYATIEIGKTYTFKIAGSRNGLFSWYPNIYEAKLAEILEVTIGG